ncbi:hypothetical protein [Nitrosospira lacus]|nr:hypothetical protein [Nitrosospira lacus]
MTVFSSIAVRYPQQKLVATHCAIADAPSTRSSRQKNVPILGTHK